MSESASPPTEARPTPRPRAAARQAWVERLQRFADAGLRPAQFCAAEGVSLPSFYAWKRRLAAEALDSAPAPADGPGAPPRLLPVHWQPPSAALELVLPGGAVVRIPPGWDFARVRSLLEALGGAPC